MSERAMETEKLKLGPITKQAGRLLMKFLEENKQGATVEEILRHLKMKHGKSSGEINRVVESLLKNGTALGILENWDSQYTNWNRKKENFCRGRSRRRRRSCHHCRHYCSRCRRYCSRHHIRHRNCLRRRRQRRRPRRQRPQRRWRPWPPPGRNPTPKQT